jgi:hypothetical protein
MKVGIFSEGLLHFIPDAPVINTQLQNRMYVQAIALLAFQHALFAAAITQESHIRLATSYICFA